MHVSEGAFQHFLAGKLLEACEFSLLLVLKELTEDVNFGIRCFEGF